MTITARACRALAGTAVVVGALALGGCGASSSSSSDRGSEPAAAGSRELYATVFDEQIAGTRPSTEALAIDVGNGHRVELADGEQLRVAFVGFGKGYDYTVPEYEAAEAEARALGFDVRTFDPRADAQLQVNQIRTIMSSGQYNALVVYPLAANLLCDVLTEQAPRRGLLVVAIGYPACSADRGEPAPGLLTTIVDTMPDEATAQAWAQKIVELADGEPQKAIVLRGPDYDINSNLAERVFERAFAGRGVEVLDALPTDFTQPGALRVIQDGLQRHRDATMVISTFPEGGAAAATAIRQAGREGDVKLVGYGADAHSAEPLESGTMQLSVPFYPYTNVKAAYQALELARRGERLEDFYHYAGHAPESLREEGDEILAVTPGNVREYADTVQEY